MWSAFVVICILKKVEDLQVPVKAHYATLAMMTLASRHDDAHPVALRSIADQHEMPLPFLTQILQQLKLAGLVISTRGPAGGYRLQRDPDQISLADIMAAVGTTSENQLGTIGSTAAHRVLQKTWSELDCCIRDFLVQVRLSQLVEEIDPINEAMFYI
jgi:Rrf2 family iron-sulfur cluster assembly transcriptional regulator